MPLLLFAACSFWLIWHCNAKIHLAATKQQQHRQQQQRQPNKLLPQRSARVQAQLKGPKNLTWPWNLDIAGIDRVSAGEIAASWARKKSYSSRQSALHVAAPMPRLHGTSCCLTACLPIKLRKWFQQIDRHLGWNWFTRRAPKQAKAQQGKPRLVAFKNAHKTRASRTRVFCVTQARTTKWVDTVARKWKGKETPLIIYDSKNILVCCCCCSSCCCWMSLLTQRGKITREK